MTTRGTTMIAPRQTNGIVRSETWNYAQRFLCRLGYKALKASNFKSKKPVLLVDFSAEVTKFIRGHGFKRITAVEKALETLDGYLGALGWQRIN